MLPPGWRAAPALISRAGPTTVSGHRLSPPQPLPGPASPQVPPRAGGQHARPGLLRAGRLCGGRAAPARILPRPRHVRGTPHGQEGRGCGMLIAY